MLIDSYLFCIQSVFISVKRIARVSRVTSRSNCLRAAVSSVVALLVPFSVPVPKFAKPPVALSSPTAQSTKGSYTNASRRVSSVSRPRFNDLRTCSQDKRNVPCEKKRDERRYKHDFLWKTQFKLFVTLITIIFFTLSHATPAKKQPTATRNKKGTCNITIFLLFYTNYDKT